jgi:hypothetical protein
MTRMTNNELIDESIVILQTMNAEDCAAAIGELRNELERVKGIARDRLATIASLRSCQGSLDECEASLSPAGNDGLYGAYLRGELD